MQPKTERFSAEILAAYEATNLPAIFAVKASDDPNVASELLVYEEIGAHGIRAKDFATALAKAPQGKLRVRINSPGGSAWDGIAMHNMLRQRGNVEAVVDGIAASAASVIAMAADHIGMHSTASMMIHNSHGLVLGNRHDMASMIQQLSDMDTKMRGIYASRTGNTVENVGALMDKETWFTAEQAVQQGFADGAIDPPKRDPNSLNLFEVMALSRDLQAALHPVEKLDTGQLDATLDEVIADLNAQYDPDGDGDDDVAEAIGYVQQAIGNCADAIEALTGTGPDDDETGGGDMTYSDAQTEEAINAFTAQWNQRHQVELRQRRLRLAAAKR